jgi:hypothetical protein
MSRFRVGVAFLALVISAGVMPVILAAGGGLANAATLGPCTGTQSGSTFTLTANCTTTAPINIPGTSTPPITTISGGPSKFTITADDVTPGSFSGAVLNSTGTTMNVENLNIVGHFSFGGCNGRTLYGILFTNASGTVNNVTVTGITENSGCQVGTAIRANGLVGPMMQTVTITNTTVTQYDKNGLTGSGAFMTMNVDHSTIGPPASLVGVIAQNGAQWGGSNAGTQGSITNSTIYGSGDDVQGPLASGTAVLLFGAKNVTVANNVITGAHTDFGIFVGAGSTGIVISHNAVGRLSADSPDLYGVGITVCSSNSPQLVALCDPQTTFSSATLICNTFSMWNHNIVGAIQISCTPFPDPPCGVPYSSSVLTVQGGTLPYTWSASGTLPPGLGISATTGTVSGTPIAAGTFHFTAHVTDSSAPPLSATQAASITVVGTCSEEAGEPPGLAESSEPGEAAPVAPITTTGLAFTG